MIRFKLEFPAVTTNKVTTTVGYLQLEYGGKKEIYTTNTISEIEAMEFTANVSSASDIKTISSKLVCPLILTQHSISNVTGHCGRSFDGNLEFPVGSTFTFGKYFRYAEAFNFKLNRSLVKRTNTAGEYSVAQYFKDMVNCRRYAIDIFYEYRGVNVVNTDELFMNNTNLEGLDVHNGLMNHFSNTRSMINSFSYTGINNVPNNFFLYNTKVLDYSYSFQECPNLSDVASYAINFRS